MQQSPATIVRKGKVPLTTTKNVENPAEQENLEMDPKGLSSFRGKGVYIAKGDKVTIQGTGGKGSSTKARKQPATWY